MKANAQVAFSQIDFNYLQLKSYTCYVKYKNRLKLSKINIDLFYTILK